VANEINYIITFVVSVVVSTIIIYVVTKLFGEKEGVGRAFLTAIIGAIVYSISYFLFGQGWIAAIIGGFVWLLALKGLYDIGWLKALGVAVIIWVFAAIVGFFLPTVTGPL
jgi:hypothetical protein